MPDVLVGVLLALLPVGVGIGIGWQVRGSTASRDRPAARTTLVPSSAFLSIARVLEDGQEEHGDRWRTRSVAHHVGKAMGHGRRALGRTPIDADSGHPHLALAAARMVLALAVHLEGRRT